MSNQKVNIRSSALVGTWKQPDKSSPMNNLHGWVSDKCHNHSFLTPHDTRHFSGHTLSARHPCE